MLAIICGEASGNLEVLDIDTKNDPTGKLWDELFGKILDYYKGNPPFAMVKTPSGGLHIYYRCETITNNKKIATLEGQTEAVIESRGLGGLVMAPPTANYQALDDRIPGNIPTISPEEREDIWAICLEFNEVTDEEAPATQKVSAEYKSTPWNEYNETDEWKEILKAANWVETHSSGKWDYWRRPGKEEGHSASWNRETRQFYVFSSSTDFRIQRGYRPFDILKILSYKGEFSNALREIKRAGFGQHWNKDEEGFINAAIVKFNSGNLLEDIRDLMQFEFDQTFRGARDTDIDQLLAAAKARSAAANQIFWVEDEEKDKVSLDRSLLLDWMTGNGYRLWTTEKESLSPTWVRIDYENHVIHYVSDDMVKNHLHEFAINNKGQYNTSVRKVRNMILAIPDTAIQSIFKTLPRVCMENIRILKKSGDDETQYFTFRNTVVRITDNNYELIKYKELEDDMLVWQADIKPHDFELADIEKEEEFNRSPVWLFLKRISGITPELQHFDHTEELPEHHPELADRFKAVISTVGYLLSSFKDKSEPYAPIFEEDTDSEKKGGGTGKRLIFDIIGQLRNVVHIDCKVWDIKKSFPWQKVKLDTDVVHLEDTEQSFKVESINNVISSGIDLEYKHQTTISLDYDDAPKIGVSTNYKTGDEADFQARRQKKIYLARYFNKNHTPKKELGILFGKQWTAQDYNLTFNILFYCLQYYLLNGVQDFKPTVNVHIKAIKLDYGNEFLTYMDNLVEDHLGKWMTKKEARNEFLDRFELQARFWPPQKFARGVEEYAGRFGYEFFDMGRNQSRTIGERDEFYFILDEKGASEKPFEAKFIKGELF